MRDYRSNDEFFQALRELMQRIEEQGNIQAARELRDGFSCLNGLTDGWALLMESIDRVISGTHGRIEAGDMAELKDMLMGVKKIVCRK
ncbi:MAG: hypothetical protein EPN25_07580 [Nitrospirae bacterium]|nr:MAG: hypothetical protein EPN25_07580 [Nitrospirota bacterium]